MGESQSKQREEELDRINQKLRAEQLELKLQVEQLKRKQDEDRHRREQEDIRRQHQSEDEKYQTQLRNERQWHIQKLLEEKKKNEELIKKTEKEKKKNEELIKKTEEEKKKNEELKKQTEEIERKLQETQQQQKQSSVFQKNEKCDETFVHQVLETVKRQTQEIQKNAQEKPPHQEQDFNQQGLIKQNNLQQPVGNKHISEPKETGNMQQHKEILNQKKENPLLSQEKDGKYLQRKENRNNSFPLKETNKQKFPLEENIHEREPSADRFHQRQYTGTRRKYYHRSKRVTEKTRSKSEELKQEKLEDLNREHQFYVSPVTTRYMWHAVLTDSLTSKWIPMPKNSSYIKVEIPKDSDEFANINSAFRSSQKAFKILHVDRIQNPYLLGCYMLKSLELQNTFGHVTEKMLFRGTKRRNVHNICEDNFNWRFQEGENSRNKFGKGVSFTSSAHNAIFYSDKDSARKMMFFARVLISKETQHDPDMIVPPPILGRWPGINNQNNVLRFDTTRALSGKVWVKYSDNDFYPQYLIIYTEENPNKEM